METVSMNGGDEKVFRFDICAYKKRYRLKVILIGAFFLTVLVLYAYFAYNYFSTRKLVTIALLSLSPILIILIQFLWELVKFLRANKTHEEDVVIVETENNSIVSVRVSLNSYRYNEYYHIKRISELKRKPYIYIAGNIQAELKRRNSKLKGDTVKVMCLRLPSYFEYMDEIYEVLERMKGLE